MIFINLEYTCARMDHKLTDNYCIPVKQRVKQTMIQYKCPKGADPLCRAT